ncbi:MAG: hypothetical protein ACK4F7_05960 [Inhella sp.]
MTARNTPRSILSPLSDVLTFATMAGLAVASAAAIASPLVERPEPLRLPTVVVTAKSSVSAEPVRLPMVVVTAKRST